MNQATNPTLMFSFHYFFLGCYRNIHNKFGGFYPLLFFEKTQKPHPEKVAKFTFTACLILAILFAFIFGFDSFPSLFWLEFLLFFLPFFW
jgi:hypothetical protein